MADQPLDEARLRRLIAVGRSLVSQLDLETVLSRVLNAARDLTQARYAALGILDPIAAAWSDSSPSASMTAPGCR